MKKITWVLIIVLMAILAIYFYSVALEKKILPPPEDIRGQEASPLMPEKAKEKKGTSQLKVTGPVWVEK